MSMRTIEAFEAELCEYTAAPYAVTMKRCCIALKGCCEYLRSMVADYDFAKTIFLPRRTYVFVPQALVRSGFMVGFIDGNWSGGYQLRPFPVWDYARRFRPDMYQPGQYQCLSFHRSKILGHTEGGAVLCDDPLAATWLRVWRDDGRRRARIGSLWNMIGESGLMYSEIAEALSNKLHWLKQYHPDGHPDLPNSDYPDLSKTDWNGIWTKQSGR